MAEGVLFDLAGKVINVLASLIAQEVKLAFGVEPEDLRNRVSIIQDLLLDAETQSSQNHVIKNWLGKLKDVLHDADDVLDDFSTEVLRRKVMSGNKMTKEVRIFFSSENLLKWACVA